MHLEGDETHRPADCELLVRKSDSASAPHRGADIRCFANSEGRISIDTLEPGLYDLHLRVREFEGTLASFLGVQVVAGQTCTDPRIQNITLSDHMDVLELALLGRFRWPLSRKAVRVHATDAGTPFTGGGFSDARGHVNVPIRKGLDSFQVCVEGYRTVRLEPAPGRTKLQLRTGIPAALTWPSDLAFDFETYEVSLSLKPRLGTLPTKYLDVHPKRPVRFEVEEPGTYDVQWWIRHKKSSLPGSTGVPNHPPQEIHVLDQEDRQSFVLAPNTKVLIEALESR